MPPKTQKTGRSAGKKSGKSAVGSVSNIQLDTWPVKAEVPENDIGKEMQKLDTLVGKFPMKDTTAIAIIISRKHIKNINDLALHFSDPATVLELKLIDKEAIVVASGQHQLLAVRKQTAGKSTQHEYKRTEEEVLVAALKEIWIWAMYIKALNNGWDKIATDMLVQAYSEKDKNTHLQKVYVILMETRCQTRCMLACHKTFPSYVGVTHLLKEAEDGNVPATDKLATLQDSIMVIPEVNNSIWADIMSKINKHEDSVLYRVEGPLPMMSQSYVAILDFDLKPIL
ncbi:hypothetical protein BDR07DRAFT_1382723 [Suillus spraguei]|nr:hypothetical protein BDR07DRAFT_1383222 [Suillus spraguei]KAG2353897.1 hypothetical protein BDR07DRAFT_1382723 [Suillus spraguei]